MTKDLLKITAIDGGTEFTLQINNGTERNKVAVFLATGALKDSDLRDALIQAISMLLDDGWREEAMKMYDEKAKNGTND